MPKHHPGFTPSDGLDGDTFSIQPREFDAEQAAPPDTAAAEAGALAQTDREQLARDFAAIENATAALRKAEPALESWTDSPALRIAKPRPIWLLIGLLWLSTAIVTAGAVVAIAALVG